ncbi:MAG: type VI secretion system-associated protein TagF [Xanthomonadales bacterium]|nr:type VI secretion system-associated protein TagF [Xanthomonadales bacterium]
MNTSETFIELGFYGKLPGYGDFIQKRLPQSFINPWHQWLLSGMQAQRENDAENWLSYYLNCPAWCFVLSAGICGKQAVTGVTIPSVDKVGRYFNFTMAATLPEEIEPASFAIKHYQWIMDIKDLALSILDDEMDQQEIEQSINSRSLDLSYSTGPRSTFAINKQQIHVVYPEETSINTQVPGLLDKLLSRELGCYGLWWHKGSSQVSAQAVACADMPSPQTYLGLIINRSDLSTSQRAATEPETDYIDELFSNRE